MNSQQTSSENDKPDAEWITEDDKGNKVNIKVFIPKTKKEEQK